MKSLLDGAEILGSPAIDGPIARKVSRQTPNLANIVDGYISRAFSEFRSAQDLWFCGSNVWRWIYGERPEPFSDIDMFATSREGFTRAKKIVELIALVPPADRPEITRSRGTGGEGVRTFTTLGWIDLWYEPERETPEAMLRSFPTDGYAHCRAAWSPSTGVLIVMPNPASDQL